MCKISRLGDGELRRNKGRDQERERGMLRNYSETAQLGFASGYEVRVQLMSCFLHAPSSQVAENSQISAMMDRDEFLRFSMIRAREELHTAR